MYQELSQHYDLSLIPCGCCSVVCLHVLNETQLWWPYWGKSLLSVFIVLVITVCFWRRWRVFTFGMWWYLACATGLPSQHTQYQRWLRDSYDQGALQLQRNILIWNARWQPHHWHITHTHFTCPIRLMEQPNFTTDDDTVFADGCRRHHLHEGVCHPPGPAHFIVLASYIYMALTENTIFFRY